MCDQLITALSKAVDTQGSRENGLYWLGSVGQPFCEVASHEQFSKYQGIKLSQRRHEYLGHYMGYAMRSFLK